MENHRKQKRYKGKHEIYLIQALALQWQGQAGISPDPNEKRSGKIKTPAVHIKNIS
jgi:hypothetical protein